MPSFRLPPAKVDLSVSCSAFTIFTKFKCTAKMVDEERAEKSLKSYEVLGAQLEFVTPKDGQAKIQMLHLRAEELENKIKALGGRWDKISLAGNSKPIFAIVPPLHSSNEWQEFEKNISMFKWKKQLVKIDGLQREVIVTCEHADLIQEEDRFKNLFSLQVGWR
ncbi:MAG: hypothetical protein HWD61_03670 [Parachlamydiaceae bacterium]|nr:MAG: hypothetical protein HWD61_03670 [Parachlamydiaceae bacterium]